MSRTVYLECETEQCAVGTSSVGQLSVQEEGKLMFVPCDANTNKGTGHCRATVASVGADWFNREQQRHSLLEPARMSPSFPATAGLTESSNGTHAR